MNTYPTIAPQEDVVATDFVAQHGFATDYLLQIDIIGGKSAGYPSN